MKPLHKMSRQELLIEGKRIGLKEGRDLGFQTGLYLALAGYYNTKPDNLVTDEQFALWSKRAEQECSRLFNEEVKGGHDVSRKAIKTGSTQETIEDSVEYVLSKIFRLREELKKDEI